GLLEHGAAIFGVGVVAEIGALVDEALAVGIDHEPERVAVPVAGAVLAVDIAVVVGVALPRDRVTARPLPVGLRTDLERHADAVASVVTGAAHLRHVPARAEIAGAPFPVCLEAAAGKHDCPAAEGFFYRADERTHPFDTVLAAKDGLCARAVTHRYAL